MGSDTPKEVSCESCGKTIEGDPETPAFVVDLCDQCWAQFEFRHRMEWAQDSMRIEAYRDAARCAKRAHRAATESPNPDREAAIWAGLYADLAQILLEEVNDE